MAKANGTLRLNIDFAHLKKVQRPLFRLLSFMAMLRAVRWLRQNQWMVRLDIEDDFCVVRLSAFRKVTVFKVGSRAHLFQVIPMGTFVSLFLLQAVINACLQSGCFFRGHVGPY